MVTSQVKNISGFFFSDERLQRKKQKKCYLNNIHRQGKKPTIKKPYNNN